jgi:RNA polymerase sigma-70 factor (ECF subfamily)
MCYAGHRKVFRRAARIFFMAAVTNPRVLANRSLGARVSERESEWGDLMRAANAGDATAYRTLLRSLEPALRSVARRGLGRAGFAGDEAEDVVQEILLAVHLKRDTWNASGPLLPWIHAIARYKLVDALRRRGRRLHVSIDEVAESLLADEPAPMLPPDTLARLVEDLPARQRDVISAVSIEGASIREAAERLRMSEGAVRVALHRGLAALNARFGRQKP